MTAMCVPRWMGPLFRLIEWCIWVGRLRESVMGGEEMSAVLRDRAMILAARRWLSWARGQELALRESITHADSSAWESWAPDRAWPTTRQSNQVREEDARFLADKVRAFADDLEQSIPPIPRE